MTRTGRFLALCMIGLGVVAEAAPAFSMPAAPALPSVPAGDITLAQWGPPPPPPPGWGPPPGYYRPPPPPGWGGYRPPPPPPGWGPPPGYYRPPPPPPGYYRPPPPPPVYRPRPRMNAHVEWCLSRYRSYNPATNRFLSSSGYYRVCVSPYSY